jgi:seryl-tRNA synthetase
MHDLQSIRANPEGFDAGLARRGLPAQSPEILALDQRRRQAQQELERLQQRRNEASKEIGQLKAKGGDAGNLLAEMARIKEAVPGLEEEQRLIADQLDEKLAALPNIPTADVPDGLDEHGNLELRRTGEPRIIDKALEHFDIGERLGLMDFAAAAKIAGSRFVVLRGELARLERALGNFMLDLHAREFGYTEMSVPLLVRDQAVFGTGQLPKFAEDLFRTTDDRWLIPTAEVSLTNLVNDSILDEGELPIRVTAYTPCFRSEAGAAGRDTRGMIRQHQFSKVELVSIAHPDRSDAEHERMTAAAETVLARLGLAYRTMLLCSGDMGFSARKTYDIEVWLPGQNAYREISSCSHCGDFQARRMKARFKNAGEKGTRFVHTLNGSGVAVGRALVALLETYQQPDGSVAVPDVLRPYLGGTDAIGRP